MTVLFSCCLRRIYDSVFLGCLPLASSEQYSERLPVAGADGVVHKEVEGRIDVGQCFHDPEPGQVKVIVATSNVHLRQKEPDEAEEGERRNTHDEQHRGADQHSGQGQLLGRYRR